MGTMTSAASATSVTRKAFLGASAAAAGAALCGSTAIALADEAAGTTFADTVAWDGEYDVVVIGFGGAGAVAATYAARNGASTLLLDKAPLGQEGGNTRYCGQMYVRPDSYENALSYYKALIGNRDYDEDLLDQWCRGLAGIEDKLVALGFDASGFQDCVGVEGTMAPYVAHMSPEYPEFAGSDGIRLYATHDAIFDGFLWDTLRAAAVAEENVDVWLESPATGLVQDPQSKAVIGVVVERGGETLNIRALNGVCLTCGGFENNEKMFNDYAGIPHANFYGTAYNEGDGVRLGLSVGCDLWHMNVFEGMNVSYPSVRATGASPLLFLPGGMPGSVVVNGGGRRFFNIAYPQRHGHYPYGGDWQNPHFSDHTWLVCDAEKYAEIEANENGGFPDIYDLFVSADTVEALAEAINVDPETLANTVQEINDSVEAGYDLDDAIDQSVETMRAFGDGPYYAIELYCQILNTQGGPRMNTDMQMLDTKGEPIPHLYVADECSGLTAYQYQDGGNVAECILNGEIAGANAAQPKDPLPAYPQATVASEPVYVPGYLDDAAE